MGGQPPKPSGPDFTKGFRLKDLKDGSMLLGQARGEAVILVRRGEKAFAVSAFCPHYGAPLVEGVVTGHDIRCPWHHACFDIRTGHPSSPPALNGLTTWTVDYEEEVVFVRNKKEQPDRRVSVSGPETFVIVGAGAAGIVAAETLRDEGFTGRVMMIGEEPDLPYDRPNISKDYLAGTAPEEWIPLRAPDYYSARGIETKTGVRVTSIDSGARQLALSSGETVSYGRLLLATGARPVRLTIRGAELPHVHYLRTLAESRAIIEQAKRARKVVVIGASFIGLEVAASLRTRGLEVAVIGKERVPFERTLGRDLGRFVKELHEANGVKFFLGESPAEISSRRVILSSGISIDADLVVIGVGVTPATELAEKAGVAVDRGIVVDRQLQTSVEGVYAAGDVARYPDPISGEPIRIEHWVLAQRQAKLAAQNMLGQGRPFRGVPFFWSVHYDLTILFTGYAKPGSESVVVGSLKDRSCVIAYRSGGRFTAAATIGRDREGLLIEEALERGDTEFIGRIVDQGQE